MEYTVSSPGYLLCGQHYTGSAFYLTHEAFAEDHLDILPYLLTFIINNFIIL